MPLIEKMRQMGLGSAPSGEASRPWGISVKPCEIRTPGLRKMVIEDIVPIVQRELGLSLLEAALSDHDETIRDLAAGLRQAITEGM